MIQVSQDWCGTGYELSKFLDYIPKKQLLIPQYCRMAYIVNAKGIVKFISFINANIQQLKCLTYTLYFKFYI